MDMPTEVIVFDKDFPKAPFYLRIQRDDGSIDHVELTAAVSLPGAVELARNQRHKPTHWMYAHQGVPMPLNRV